jgi:hypothetical protein
MRNDTSPLLASSLYRFLIIFPDRSWITGHSENARRPAGFGPGPENAGFLLIDADPSTGVLARTKCSRLNGVTGMEPARNEEFPPSPARQNRFALAGS